MKKNSISFLFLLLAVPVFCQSSTDVQPLSVSNIITSLFAVYEIVVRFIPTSKTLSIITKALQAALYLSDYLDRKKK